MMDVDKGDKEDNEIGHLNTSMCWTAPWRLNVMQRGHDPATAVRSMGRELGETDMG